LPDPGRPAQDEAISALELVIDASRLPAVVLEGQELLIQPGNHGDYLGENVMSSGESHKPKWTATWNEEFLDAPAP